VILISLSLSWITAVSTTPLLCALLLKSGSGGSGDPYGGVLFRGYRRLLAPRWRHRWLTLAAVAALFAAAVWDLATSRAGFSPSPARPCSSSTSTPRKGSDIRATRDDALAVAAWLRRSPRCCR
jgi:multidrug efflux pump subunit AcrB